MRILKTDNILQMQPREAIESLYTPDFLRRENKTKKKKKKRKENKDRTMEN